MSNAEGDLYIGIDLGTSRSAIATSRGQRHVVESYVGWPLDMVARKVIQRDVLIGREALDNRMMLDLHRPLERGLLKEGSEKDQAAVRQLMSHLLDLAGVREVRENGTRVRAVVGVPAEALRVNKEHLREALQGLVDGIIIVSEPFAVAYGLETLLHALVIDMGAGTTDFCIMKGHYPTDEDQRTLPNAGDWVDEQLARLLSERKTEVNVSIHTVRQWKEAWSFVGEQSKPLKVTVPVAGKPTEIDITEEMRLACEGLIAPVAETMIDLVAASETEYQEKVRQNIILAGGSSAIRGFAKRLEEELTEYGGGKIRVVDDPVFAGCDGGLALATDAPGADWEKLSS
jgi:rod shape-determining protein MreB